MVFGSGFMALGRVDSELVENQGSAVVQPDLCWLQPGALVEAIGIRIGLIPRTVVLSKGQAILPNRQFFVRGAGGQAGLLEPRRASFQRDR